MAAGWLHSADRWAGTLVSRCIFHFTLPFIKCFYFILHEMVLFLCDLYARKCVRNVVSTYTLIANIIHFTTTLHDSSATTDQFLKPYNHSFPVHVFFYIYRNFLSHSVHKNTTFFPIKLKAFTKCLLIERQVFLKMYQFF